MSESLQDFEQEEVEEEIESSEDVESDDSEEESKPARQETSYIDYDQLPDDLRGKVKMRVDSDYKTIKKLERQSQDAARKAQELEDRLAELNKPKEVPAPSADDFYTDPDEAKRKLDEHISSLNSQREWDFEKQRREQQRKAEMMEESVKMQNQLFEKAKNAGIDESELRYSAAVLMQHQVDDNMSEYLVSHEYGPQLINHLAKNPLELQTIKNLSPFQVGVKLNEMAKAFKPKKVSKAPAPDDPIMGSGVDYNEGSLLKGSKIF